MLLFLFIFLIKADEEFILMGLNKQFNIIPNTTTTCNFIDYTCSDLLCELLAQDFITYIAFTQLTSIYICPERFPKIQTNMFTMLINSNNRLIYNITSCHTIDLCYD